MIKVKNYKLSSAQFEENAAHLERAQWILNQDRKFEGDDLREVMQEIGDVLENFATIRERAETKICTDEFCTNLAETGADYCAGHAPYLKPSSTKKPEKVGNIRI